MSDDWQEIAFEPKEVEWDPVKDHVNQIKHDISFKEAAKIFASPIFAIYQDWHDEDRYGILGVSGGRVLFVVCAESVDYIRIVSARKATQSEKRRYGALVVGRH
jgi:uncharacterized protein